MSEKTQKRREALREAIIQAAQKRIITDGAHSLRARDLAGDVGCALGGIYNVFTDMADVQIAVNAITFRELGEFAARALADHPNADAATQMQVLGRAYLDYALKHTNAWRALFDIPQSAREALPDWYLRETEALLSFIAMPIQLQRPDLEPDAIPVVTKTLFAAIHGVVIMGLDGHTTSNPDRDLPIMIEQTVRAFSTPQKI